MDQVKISKYMSMVLRHRPDLGGLTLDAAGWTEVDALLEALSRAGLDVDLPTLEEVVFDNDKQRFEFDEDGTRIRARQGHSVPVTLGYAPANPPPLLYHGTVARLIPGIRATGLQKMKRHAVHLSPDEATARRVGARRGTPLLLAIRAEALAETGAVFFHTPNNVWLTDHVPPEFIVFPEG